MRELSSIFIAWFVVFLLLLLRAVTLGAAEYADFLDWAASPWVVVLNTIAAAFLVLHVVTWFSLTPKAMAISVRGRPVPSVAVIAGQYAALARRVGLRDLAGDPMTARRIEPLVWLMFSGGGVLAAVFLPVLVFLFAFAFPLGWITPPSHDHLLSVAGNPLTVLVLMGLFTVLLVHSAHRFRYTLYDGLQIKAKGTVAVLCYGGALVGAGAAFLTLALLLDANY